MSAVTAAAPLDVARARRLTEQLRQALTLALDLLTQVYDGRAWEALGYPSWDSYVDAELPELRVLMKGMPKAERQAAVAAMGRSGMSVRAIAATGPSVGTVHNDLKDAGVQLATVTSLDGRRRPGSVEVTPAPKARVTNTDRTVALLATAGPSGLTWRELGKRARWHHGQASGALSTLHRQGRIVRTTTYRDGCAVYVVAD